VTVRFLRPAVVSASFGKPRSKRGTTTDKTASRQDIYSRVTAQIVADLEQGVRPWTKPWNAEHAAGRITRPLRHNGQPYAGINILMLWTAAVALGFGAPIWMTFRQAKELGGCVRKGEKGCPVVRQHSHPHGA
jgi:antirestriction protein ArdC